MGSVGRYSSITIGGDGLALVSYEDNTNKNLKVAHCNDQDCSNFKISSIDNSGLIYYHTSITSGIDGLGLISY